MKKKLVMSIMSAIMVCASSMTAMAAPEIVEVNGVNEVFDAEYYAAVYPDVAAAFGTDKELLLQHYITFGQSEGRLSCAPETDLSQIIAAMQNEQPQISQTEQNLFEEQDFAALLSLEPALIATEDGTGKQANVTLIVKYQVKVR